jgi:hypothetical protein
LKNVAAIERWILLGVLLLELKANAASARQSTTARRDKARQMPSMHGGITCIVKLVKDLLR